MSSPTAHIPLQKAYIDTNIFVYHFHFTKQASLTARANSFLNQIKTAKIQGVTTTFAITEFLCVMLETLCACQGKVDKKDVDGLRLAIENFIRNMGIVLYDSDELATNMSYGKSVIFSRCEQFMDNVSCVVRRDGSKTVVRGADILHLVFARIIGVDCYATFDQDFQGQSEVPVKIL